MSDTGKPTSRDVFNDSTDPVKDCNLHMCTVEHVKHVALKLAKQFLMVFFDREMFFILILVSQS